MFQDKGLVNLDASHYSGSAFTSTVDPRTVNPNVLPSISSNIQAANASRFVGGRKTINRKKINKISRMYKMKGSRKHCKRMKSRVRSRYNSRSRSRSRSRSSQSSRRRRTSRRGQSMNQKGGYAQYQNNMPMTNSFSTGGHLSPSLSAMANPVPYQTLSNCTNCVDSYNHFTNAGFQSKGSY
jgi:hypothetical protein